MTKTYLLCKSCGARWISEPGIAATRIHGGCLRCGSSMLETRPLSEAGGDVEPPESPSDRDSAADDSD